MIATYGRIRIVADVLKGKTQRLITVGGGGVYARSNDDRWGPLGSPPMVTEDSPLSQDPNGPRPLLHDVGYGADGHAGPPRRLL